MQNRAAAGHTDIQTYSSGFRAVGSTEDVDARDNTSTTYTSSDKGVPIYWLDGNKVVDDYEDFYDGDPGTKRPLSRTNPETLSPPQAPQGCGPAAITPAPKQSAFGFSNALGRNPAKLGTPNNANSDSGPLSGSNVTNRSK